MKRRPEVLAVIPARGGSKGIPGKNLALLGGKPLIAWSIEAAQKSRHITRVVVSTDSEEIADAARDLGAEVPFLRPARIAGDRAEIGHAFGHVFSRLARRGYVPDVEAHLYPTHPFRNPRLVDGMLSRLISRGLRAAFTARPVRVGRDRFFSMDVRGSLTALYDPSRYAPGASAGGAATFFRSYGLCSARARGACPGASWCLPLTAPVSLIDIDAPEDLILAEEVIRAGLFDFDLR